MGTYMQAMAPDRRQSGYMNGMDPRNNDLIQSGAMVVRNNHMQAKPFLLNAGGQEMGYDQQR